MCPHVSASSSPETTSQTSVESSSGKSTCAALASLLRNRSMSRGAKDIWNCIMSLERIGKGCIGMRVTQKKKIAKDHANYESAEDDDQDFNPYRSRQPCADFMKDQGFGRNRQGDTLGKVNQLRDKFEYDREKRMREKAFAPMNGQNASNSYVTNSMNQPFDTQRYFSDSD
ncbi:hypothetical protein CRYUN_Cryun14cG0129100 [Craigia yunnanensis]